MDKEKKINNIHIISQSLLTIIVYIDTNLNEPREYAKDRRADNC
jgi:hypothetical protein